MFRFPLSFVVTYIATPRNHYTPCDAIIQIHTAFLVHSIIQIHTLVVVFIYVVLIIIFQFCVILESPHDTQTKHICCHLQMTRIFVD